MSKYPKKDERKLTDCKVDYGVKVNEFPKLRSCQNYVNL